MNNTNTDQSHIETPYEPPEPSPAILAVLDELDRAGIPWTRIA